MDRPRLSTAALGLTLVAMLAVGPPLAGAEEIWYFGTNRLVFEPVGQNAAPDRMGKGIIDYRGGEEPDSRWRATFRFNQLNPGNSYTVMVLGRFGADGSDEASELSPLCSFEAKDNGKGRCFWYFSSLARLDVVQLRAGDENAGGQRMMQASRNGEFGSIETEPNRYSPGGEVSEPEEASRTNKANKRR